MEWNTEAACLPCSPPEVWTSSVYLLPPGGLALGSQATALPPVPLIEQLLLTCVLDVSHSHVRVSILDPFPIPPLGPYTASYRTRYARLYTHTIVRVVLFCR